MYDETLIYFTFTKSLKTECKRRPKGQVFGSLQWRNIEQSDKFWLWKKRQDEPLQDDLQWNNGKNHYDIKHQAENLLLAKLYSLKQFQTWHYSFNNNVECRIEMS